ncbi:MAG: protein-L-isoaspartate(D-aspartate) O-methyltransferase [Sphingomonadaceae bacterium]|nr:protein-L-isoaspartate(D-aspartate) O-methyltransferase [Sphingomonadaceae bacterium]
MVDEVKASLLEGGVDLSSENISRVVKAMLAVPREEFLPPWARDFAYLPYALNIGSRQTISQPFVVALMAMAATIPPGAAVLDVGTGSGYGAAVLSMLADTVVTIEIKTKLARDAEQQFSALGFRNITTVIGDGFAGVPAFAPFDVILVAAAASQVPQPLVEQLKPGGRLIMPLGPDPENEHLVMLTKQPDGTLRQVTLGPVQFVPLTGSGARA